MLYHRPGPERCTRFIQSAASPERYSDLTLVVVPQKQWRTAALSMQQEPGGGRKLSGMYVVGMDVYEQKPIEAHPEEPSRTHARVL